MRHPAQALRQLARQWHAVARDAERRAAQDALAPPTRKMLSAQAQTRRACAQDLERVLQEVGLHG